MNSLIFSCTALRGTNKVGLIKPDEHGYYDVVLGALNAYNRAGDYYPFTEQVRAIFERSSSFMRRITEGALRGEREHPMPNPGESAQDYLRRVTVIEPSNISHHIREVRLDFDNIRDDKGRKIIAVLGKVKPSGPQGALLEASLKNPHENVAFSVRSLSRNRPLGGGRLERNIVEIITWDWVTEPGIKVADKYYSPSLESLQRAKQEELVITPGLITSMQAQAKAAGVSLENSSVNFDSLMVTMGWRDSPTKRILDW